jgi:multiple sugar transport system substrate-binding protein
MSSTTPPGRSLGRRAFLSLAGGGAAAGTGLLTACGGGTKIGSDSGEEPTAPAFTGDYDGPKVTLEYWNGFTGGDGPYMKAMLDAFNTEYQDRIKVNNTTRQWQDLYPALPTAITAGKGPDVAVIHNDAVATSAARGTLIPLDDVVASVGMQEEEFIPAVWQAGLYDGKRYSVPLDVHCLAIYWNAGDLARVGLDAAPGDGEGFTAALDELQAAGVRQPFWMPNKWPAHLMFMSLLWQFGGELYNAEGTAALWGSDAGVAALSWMADQVSAGYGPGQVAQDAQYTAFKNGEGSFTWDGIWQINDLRENAGKLDWGMSPVPAIGPTPAVWSASHNFVLTSQAAKDDNKVQAAKFFIDYLSKQSTQWAEAGMIPARNSVREDPSVSALPQVALAADTGVFRFLPSVPGVGDVQTAALELAVQQGVLGKARPAEALADGVRKADKMLTENARKYAK